MRIETIQLKLEGNKVFARSKNSEAELEFYPGRAALCAKGYSHLANARLLVPVDPIWWLSDEVQSGEWAIIEFTREG